MYDAVSEIKIAHSAFRTGLRQQWVQGIDNKFEDKPVYISLEQRYTKQEISEGARLFEEHIKSPLDSNDKHIS